MLETKSANISDRQSNMIAGGSPVRARQRAIKSVNGIWVRALTPSETQSMGPGAKLFMCTATPTALDGFYSLSAR